MITTSSLRSLAAGLAGLALLVPQTTRAANGMNLIGYGAESVAMGGADLAITSSPSAMNINPAGIGHCLHPELDFGLGMMNPSLGHTDGLGNDQVDVLDRYPMPFLGYVHPVKSLIFGLGLFVQGGMGAEYQNLRTPFSALAGSGTLPPDFFEGDQVPATDGTLTNVAHVRLTPAVSWRAASWLFLGAALNVSYARADLELFPDTSVLADLDQSGVAGDSPRDGFFGMEVQDVSDVGYALRAGFQYERGSFSLGGAFCTETTLELSGGSMDMNLSALGLGNVGYDCRMSNFHWPRQAGLGLAYRRDSFLIAGDVDWIDWSSAIETITIMVENPDDPMALPSREISMPMGWEDQWVWAVGVELRPWSRWALRAGYNHGDSPVPDSMLRPLFPAIAENHITGGIGVTTGPWTFDAALEYVTENQKTNDNPDPSINPFGPGYQETLSQFVGHFTVRLSL